MKTDATGVKISAYGASAPPIPLDGSIPPANANTPTPLGNAGSGSYDLASGVMTITLSDSHADGTTLGPGDDLAAINVRTDRARPDAGQKAQNNPTDLTGTDDYFL